MAEKKTTGLNITEKLMRIQSELKAPKNLYNSFGKYKYRNAEGIQEALKPLEKAYNVATIIYDTVEEIGGRIYVKATARIIDCESGEIIEATAYAREAETKKGMDDAQVTGATSSYARKYALNGLFLLDDTKDVDSEEYQTQQKTAEAPKPEEHQATKTETARAKYMELISYCKNSGIDINQVVQVCGLSKTSTAEDFEMAIIYAKNIMTGGEA